MQPCSRADLNLFVLLQVEEVPGDFTQSDLATDDVMLLDTGDQVMLLTQIHAQFRWQTGEKKWPLWFAVNKIANLFR